jgi:NADH-quinone oxidoreductase subunit M
MILVWLIAILLIGGALAWVAAKVSRQLAKWISLVAVVLDFIIALSIWITYNPSLASLGSTNWLIKLNTPWIPQFGISFYLALDGLSLVLIMLTTFLGILSVLTSWKSITKNVGFYHFNLLWILAGITGVFLSLDLFLFYFFWEVMLIPMYFLIGIWGHENRIYASYKFFIFTQASGLLMFLAILGLYFIHGANTGIYTFDYTQLLGTSLSPTAAMWLMLGFLIAFIVKLPAVPFHNWLPDAHTEAPTAGSVILAGLLLKTGAYGLIRFVIPLFPGAVKSFAPIGMLLGVIGILYGAKLAFAQIDFKRLVAYTSVSHMGFVLLGVFALNQLAMQGVVMQMLAHGISTGALFILVGSLQDRIHTRNLNVMGGMWDQVPRMGAAAMIFTMASLGLPGLGNFIAEFLTLAGAYQSNSVLTIIAVLGFVAATIYSLRIIQKVFHGNKQKKWELPDLDFREIIIMGSMTIVIVWLGIYPQTVIKTVSPTVNTVVENATKINHQFESGLINGDNFPNKNLKSNNESLIEGENFLQQSNRQIVSMSKVKHNNFPGSEKEAGSDNH